MQVFLLQERKLLITHPSLKLLFSSVISVRWVSWLLIELLCEGNDNLSIIEMVEFRFSSRD